MPYLCCHPIMWVFPTTKDHTYMIMQILCANRVDPRWPYCGATTSRYVRYGVSVGSFLNTTAHLRVPTKGQPSRREEYYQYSILHFPMVMYKPSTKCHLPRSSCCIALRPLPRYTVHSKVAS